MIYSSAMSDQGPRSYVNNGPGSDWNSAHILPPPPHHLLKSNSNNGPYPGRSNLESDERYTCSNLPLIVSWWVLVSWRVLASWWVLYLAKGPKHDFNNAPRAFIQVRLEYWPLPRPSQSCVRWSYICSCLLLMVSWQVPYLAKAYRLDLNNGLRCDSNSGPIVAPRRLFESDLNNGHSNTELQT